MSLAQPTLADIWRLFQETDRLLKERSLETERRFQETERLLKESSLETERLLKESSLETERFLKERSLETDRFLKERSLETERLIKERSLETERRFQDTERTIKGLSKNVGDLHNRLGEFVEQMVEPTVVRLFQARGLNVHEVHPNVEIKRDGEIMEIDLLVVNEKVIVAVECKSKMTMGYVKKHLKLMEQIKRMMPAYRHHQALGAVAAMVMPETVARFAEEQGFYVLAQSGETFEIRNEPDFSAKTW